MPPGITNHCSTQIRTSDEALYFWSTEPDRVFSGGGMCIIRDRQRELSRSEHFNPRSSALIHDQVDPSTPLLFSFSSLDNIHTLLTTLLHLEISILMGFAGWVWLVATRWANLYLHWPDKENRDWENIVPDVHRRGWIQTTHTKHQLTHLCDRVQKHVYHMSKPWRMIRNSAYTAKEINHTRRSGFEEKWAVINSCRAPK